MSRHVILIDGPMAGEVLPLPESGMIAYQESSPVAVSDILEPRAVLPETRYYHIHRYAFVGLVNVGVTGTMPSDEDARRAILGPRGTWLLERPKRRIEPLSIPVWTMGEGAARQIAEVYAEAAEARLRHWWCPRVHLGWLRPHRCRPGHRCEACQTERAVAEHYQRMSGRYVNVAADAALVALVSR